MSGNRKIRVLIVDDSAIVRKILSETLSSEPEIEVAGTAPDPYIARDKILSLKPDVLTLDIEMPRMDGLTFLKRLMHFHQMPAIVISSLTQSSCRTAIEALESGAVEVLAKPGGPYSVGDLKYMLASKVRAAASARLRLGPAVPEVVRPPARPYGQTAGPEENVLAIGASTGGTEAIAAIVRELPANAPGVVVAQHIPPQFSRAFTNRLNSISAVEVKEAEDNDTLRPGLVLVAPGDFHMVLRKAGSRYYVDVKTGPKVCYQRPSVDVLFLSVAEVARAASAALLTGMGSDGAQGLLRLRRCGAHTIAQNEATCVVYGMPREAITLGAADQVLPLSAIAQALLAPRKRRADQLC